MVEAATAADGVRPLSEHSLLTLAAPAQPGFRHLLTRAAPSGALTGYAQVGADAAELLVAPDARRAGIGSALLSAVTGQARGGAVRIWSHGYLPPARAFAAAHGLHVVRELWQMTRPSAGADGGPEHPLSPPRLPGGFMVHPFAEADLPEWLTVNAAAFATHPEQGRISADDVRARMATRWFDADGFLLIRDTGDTRTDPRGRLAAYHWTKIEPDRQPRTGEVYVVGIDPAYQGRGLARPVTQLGLAYLAGAGVAQIELYVDGDNAPAVATYRGLGFARTALDVMLAA
ncbi:MAG: mycothiol synthase [Austwickia sp.]|mgnify:CR=1 FL=1|nr:mycothiol synthase [Austwickia sp.]MBK8436385.1 mycothiol synthase [Austwickia sp.]MBK9102061.1 mycothiol synthase [Austwickia sp.]